MRRLRRDKLGDSPIANCYHVVSRVVDRRIVFGDLEQERLLQIVRKQLEFSGLQLLAFCVMGNHFHLLLRVPDKETALAGWTEEDFLDRLRVLSDESYTHELLKNVEMWRRNGCSHLIAELAGRVRARLFDLSSFMKEVKQKFSAWFNFTNGRVGTLWEERFRSVLVEGTGGRSADGLSALFAVAAYIDLNPVRAGLVEDPKDYRWCGYAEAVGGGKSARRGLAICAGFAEGEGWRRVGAAYRKVLFAAGEARDSGVTPNGRTKSKRGFSRAEIDAVWASGGKLSVGQVLRCRVSFFTDGLAIGRAEFLGAFGNARGAGMPETTLRRIGLGAIGYIGGREAAVRPPG